MNVQEILHAYKNFVVIGVTSDPNKYGYKIFKRLLDLGYTTYGVSPKYQNVLQQELYLDLLSIDKEIDVVIFVVSPKYGLEYVKQCKQLGIQHLWLQPGTYDEEILKIIKDNHMSNYQHCILVETANM